MFQRQRAPRRDPEPTRWCLAPARPPTRRAAADQSNHSRCSRHLCAGTAGWRAAAAAAPATHAARGLGALYAAVSAYWGAGGTALLDTIGGTLEREGRAGAVGLLAVVWLTVMVKLAASAIGILAVVQPRSLSGPP